MAVEYGSLPFREAIEFFRGKRLVPTERWTDLRKEAHDAGFMVAGAMQADLLVDLQSAVDREISQGATLKEFRRDFDRIVKARGWTGWTGEGTDAGVAWRTRVIYETNLRTAYQAGRWAQVQELKSVNPYLIYRHSDLSVHPRELHKSWDGLVVAVDDPWVQTHWPPNGWGCKCRMFSIGPRDLAKLDKSGPDTPPDDGTRTWVDKATGEVHIVPNGIDPGWDYAPGASWVARLRQDIERKAATLPPEIGARLARSIADEPPPLIPLISLAGIDVAYAEGIREVLVAFRGANRAGHLPHGVKRLTVTNDAGISNTDQRGSFSVSRMPLAGLNQRSGLAVMTAALTKIKRGELLDFYEEYGLESLWHEILHNDQADTIKPDTPMEQLRIMEGLHQVLARQTYPKLLAALGVEPRFLREVRENGPAYPKSARGMTDLLRAAGLMDEEFVLRADALEALLKIDRELSLGTMSDSIANRIAQLNGHGIATIRQVLRGIENAAPMTQEEVRALLRIPND